MKTDEVKKMAVMDRFVYWINEREKVAVKKLAELPKPWTDDEILQQFKFCNVRRMDDRVSRWLFENWYDPNYGHCNALIACTIARFINLPTSLEIIGYPSCFWSKHVVSRMKRQLREHRDGGNTVFNSAYMVRGNDGMDKIECVFDYYVAPVAGIPIGDRLKWASMREAWERVSQCYGLGSFMAGQVVADLCHAYPYTWKDRWMWAPIGPGSKRGMNRVLGRPLRSPMNQKQFNRLLQDLIRTVRPHIADLSIKLEGIDYQNCLCEFDKYERVLWGMGRPKHRYPGGA